MREALGPYELVKRLGVGATAEVFMAVGPAMGRTDLLAVKALLAHLSSRPDAVRAFLKEARMGSLLRHPNLVQIYDVGEADGRPYLAMELVRGWPLSALTKRLKAVGERLPLDAACEAVRQAALGLHFAHQTEGAQGLKLGLVHRDVSPQNVLVTESGSIKVVDFGLAKATRTDDTNSQAIKGKLRYMPPEQLRSQPLDARADVYALGAVLWELVCGEPLHRGDSDAEVLQDALFAPQHHPDEVQKGLPRALVELLVRCVERSVDKRLQSCSALAEALAPLSSPSARTTLAQLVATHFEAMPRTVAEACPDLVLEGVAATASTLSILGPPTLSNDRDRTTIVATPVVPDESARLQLGGVVPSQTLGSAPDTVPDATYETSSLMLAASFAATLVDDQHAATATHEVPSGPTTAEQTIETQGLHQGSSSPQQKRRRLTSVRRHRVEPSTFTPAADDAGPVNESRPAPTPTPTPMPARVRPTPLPRQNELSPAIDRVGWLKTAIAVMLALGLLAMGAAMGRAMRDATDGAAAQHE